MKLLILFLLISFYSFSQNNVDTLSYEDLKQIVLKNELRTENNFYRHITAGDFYKKSRNNFIAGTILPIAGSWLIYYNATRRLKNPNANHELEAMGIICIGFGIVFNIICMDMFINGDVLACRF